jgi:hypothetical protein
LRPQGNRLGERLLYSSSTASITITFLTEEGKSRKQALRCLKRHLARAVCRILMAVDRRRKTSTTPKRQFRRRR